MGGTGAPKRMANFLREDVVPSPRPIRYLNQSCNLTGCKSVAITVSSRCYLCRHCAIWTCTHCGNEGTLAHQALASTFGSFFPGVAVLCPTRSGAGHKKRGFKFYEPRMARITRILKTDLIRVIRAIRGSI